MTTGNLAVLHKLVSLLRPGWEIRLCPVPLDGMPAPRCMLCRPSEDDDCPGMVEATGHYFTGVEDPQIALWLDDLAGLTEAGILLQSQPAHVWTLADKLPAWS